MDRNKHKNWVAYTEFDEGIQWPEDRILPSFSKIDSELDMFTITYLNDASKTMLTALQGLVNKKKTRIYINGVNALDEGVTTWRDRLGLKCKEYFNIYEFIKKYQDEVDGVVLYEEHSPHFRNLALTVAGIKNLLPVERRMYASFKDNGIDLEVKENLCGLACRSCEEVYTYLYSTYWKDCTKRVLVSLCPQAHTGHIRDMAAAIGAAVVWLDPREEKQKNILDLFLADMTAGKSVCLGWWPEERSGIGEGTSYGISTIPSDFYENPTVFSACDHIMRMPAIPKKPQLENKIYLSIFLSDGDNVQYCQHHMSNLWKNKDRGTIPLNWTVSPGLADIGPGILNYYFDTATENDCFVSGPSGLGYALIYDEHNDKLFLSDEELTDAYTELSNRYLTKTGLRSITVWDQLRDIHFRSYEKNCRALYGLTQEDWFQKPAPLKPHIENNRLAFLPNYPAYAETVEDIYRQLEDTIKNYDGKAPMFLATQGVTWSLTPANMTKLMERFNELVPGKIEVMRADHFFALYNEANNIPFNIALSKDCVATAHDNTSDPMLAINGSAAKKYQWVSNNAENAYIMLDLGAQYLVSRYVVKHAGFAGMDRELNTYEFTVEVSVDGKAWTVVDDVDENIADITDVDIEPCKARYFKINIKNPGSDNVVRIGDIEVYGVK